MADDKTKTGGQDRSRISLSEDYEVRDWAARRELLARAMSPALHWTPVGLRATRGLLGRP